MADNVKSIKIINNVYKADIINEKEHERYDRLWTYVDRACDFALRLEHSLSDILIRKNVFIGSNALFSSVSFGEKRSIIIDNNYIKNQPLTRRSSLVISQVDGLIIKNNNFINTGSTLIYLDNPQFIVIGPTNSSKSVDRYARNIQIINNNFSFSDNSCDVAYILAHSIYDKANCNTLSTLNNIIVKRNKSDVRGDILLVTDDFNNVNDASVILKKNKFKSGVFVSNINSDIDIEKDILKRSSQLKSNTVVEKDGHFYYVIIGGKTSNSIVDYTDDEYIKDGNVVLRKIQIDNR